MARSCGVAVSTQLCVDYRRSYITASAVVLKPPRIIEIARPTNPFVYHQGSKEDSQVFFVLGPIHPSDDIFIYYDGVTRGTFGQGCYGWELPSRGWEAGILALRGIPVRNYYVIVARGGKLAKGICLVSILRYTSLGVGKPSL